MAEFTTMTLKCRCTRCVKLYASVYDSMPVNIPLAEDLEFYSRKQYKSGSVEMVYVSEGINCETTPIGYWCPMNVLQIQPVIEDRKPLEVDRDGSIPINSILKITASGASVYASSEGTEKCPNGLAVGDVVQCSRKVEFANNGIVETRYQIAAVQGADQSLVGSWITLNRAIVRNDGPKVIMHNPMVREAGIMSLAADDSEGGSGGGGAGVRPTVDGTTNGVTYGTDARPGNFAGHAVGTGQQTTQVTTLEGNTIDVPETPTTESTGAEDNETINYDTINFDDLGSVLELYERYGFKYTATATQSLMSIPIGRMLFVHGMPFQYTHITDRRGNSTMAWGASEYEAEQSAVTNGSTDLYGRSFATNIAANMPIAVIAPGKPKFLTSVREGLFGYAGGGDDARNGWLGQLGALINGGEGAENNLLSTLADSEGDYQYYSIEIDLTSYFQYVNSLCQTSAMLMDLAGERYRGVPCKSIDWKKYNSAAEQDFSIGQTILGLAQGVSFAFDPQSSVSDTINNSTQESQFASMFNTISGKAREMEFILGYSGGNIPDFIDSTNYVQASSAHMQQGGILASMSNVVGRIGSWINNSAHGMNVRFPEIWSDSNYSKSYDLDMHFIAPYATAFCKWRYVLVPFFHIFALAAPKSDGNISQYSSPFLIRAYSKGFFNVEMGIIESITWKRFGDKDMISEDGIPTQIDVSISFKDLYHALAMSKYGSDGILGTDSSDFFNNSGLMDLVGTLSGVNMNRITIAERAALFLNAGLNAFGALGSNFMGHISDRIRNVADRYLFGI